MNGRKPTSAEKKHMSEVRAIGCIACYNMGIETPEQFTLIHHIDGSTKEGAHFNTLPLCELHHSPHRKTGLHNNLTRWEKEHGLQEDLLEQVKGLLCIE